MELATSYNMRLLLLSLIRLPTKDDICWSVDDLQSLLTNFDFSSMSIFYAVTPFLMGCHVDIIYQ